MNPKISVVIPFYNSELTIKNTIESILGSTFKDFEIICVDDASTDGSLAILEELSQYDERIKIYRTNKIGTGMARNFGITNSSGEYIAFCDSDDQYSKYMLEKLYNVAIKYDSDIVECSYLNKFPDGTFCIDNQFDFIKKIFVDYNSYNYRNNYKYVPFIPKCAWNKLYKKEFLSKNNIYFSDCLMGEDHTFVIKAFLCANIISYVNEPLYTYNAKFNFGSGPKSRKYFSTFQLYDDLIGILNDLRLNKNKKFMQAFKKYFVDLATYHYNCIPKEQQNEYIELVKSKLSKDISNLVLAKIYNKPTSFKEYIFRKRKLKKDDYLIKCFYILNFKFIYKKERKV